MIALAKKLWNDESGQGLVEYALILGLISIVAVAILTTMGTSVRSIFTKINTALTNAEGNVS